MAQQRKKRILVISGLPLMPITGGGSARILSYIDYFRAAGFQVELVTVHHDSKSTKALERHVDRLWIYRPGKRAEKKRAGGRVRRVAGNLAHGAFMKVWERGGWRLAQALCAVAPGCHTWFPSAIADKQDDGFDRYVGKVTREIRPVAIIGNNVWSSRAFNHSMPNALRCLDVFDVQYVRVANARQSGNNMVRCFCTKHEEVRELRRADVLFAIQREEQAVFQRLCPDREVLLVEHAVEIPERQPTPDAPLSLLFVGNQYEPNLVAIRDFIKLAWPEVRRALPECRLIVCGKVCRDLDQPGPGVELTGIVDSLDPYYRKATLVLNPVTFGTGLKIKTVEALAYAKCLVTTECGISGLPLPDTDPPYCVVRPVAEMAQPIIALAQDPHQRRAIENQAYDFAVQRFSPQYAYAELETRIRNVPAY